MQCFSVTQVTDRKWQYYVANYPAKRKPWSRKAGGRAQKKFTTRQAAEEFLAEVRREWEHRGKVELGLDSALHYDVMRAKKVIADIPRATLEKGALLLRMCVSAKELRGTGYEAPEDRRVEMSPRMYLACHNEAKRRGINVSEAIEGMIGGWLLSEAGKQIAERGRIEAQEYQELVKRNQETRRMLAERGKQEEMMRKLGILDLAFEEGRRSVLEEQRLRRNEWRRKRKERESNGNSDLP
jgi:hypothetical protein